MKNILCWYPSLCDFERRLGRQVDLPTRLNTYGVQNEFTPPIADWATRLKNPVPFESSHPSFILSKSSTFLFRTPLISIVIGKRPKVTAALWWR